METFNYSSINQVICLQTKRHTIYLNISTYQLKVLCIAFKINIEIKNRFEKIESNNIEEQFQQPTYQQALQEYMMPTKIINNIKYRAFQSNNDLEAIREMFSDELSEQYNLFTYKYFTERYPDLTIFACDTNQNDKIIGCSMCMLQNCSNHIHGYIGMICVLPQYKRQHIGQYLENMSVELMKQRHVEVLSLETEDDNIPAIKFYQKLGYEISEHHYRYYMNSKGAVTMYKILINDQKRIQQLVIQELDD